MGYMGFLVNLGWVLSIWHMHKTPVLQNPSQLLTKVGSDLWILNMGKTLYLEKKIGWDFWILNMHKTPFLENPSQLLTKVGLPGYCLLFQNPNQFFTHSIVCTYRTFKVISLTNQPDLTYSSRYGLSEYGTGLTGT